MNDKELIQLLIADAVDKAISYYGLEGCEEAIKRVYKRHDKLRNSMLEEFYRRIKK